MGVLIVYAMRKWIIGESTLIIFGVDIQEKKNPIGKFLFFGPLLKVFIKGYMWRYGKGKKRWP